MSKRNADFTVAGMVACSYVVLAVTRLSIDEKIGWWIAGLLAGASTWLALRYALYRIFGFWFLGRGGTPVRRAVSVMLTFGCDIAGAWLSGTIASVLVLGYPLQTSWQLFRDLLPTPLWTLGIMAAFAIVGAALVRVFDPRGTTPSSGNPPSASADAIKS